MFITGVRVGRTVKRNVLVFVADSLRWDALPEAVAEQGVAFKTVAQGPFSAPSFATLGTGLYPLQHGVHNWTDRMPAEVRTVFELPGLSGGFWQAGDAAGHEIFPILRREGKTSLDEVQPPFFQIVRNDDPHTPYAGSGAGTAREYAETRGGDWNRMRREYVRGVGASVEAFEECLRTLEARGLREETLVVFTSDHGELLGEHGEVGHTTPITPELAYVPTVFVSDALEARDFAADPETDVIEHVDVVETALSAIGMGGRADRGRRPRDERARAGVGVLSGGHPTGGAVDVLRRGGVLARRRARLPAEQPDPARGRRRPAPDAERGPRGRPARAADAAPDVPARPGDVRRAARVDRAGRRTARRVPRPDRPRRVRRGGARRGRRTAARRYGIPVVRCHLPGRCQSRERVKYARYPNDARINLRI